MNSVHSPWPVQYNSPCLGVDLKDVERWRSTVYIEDVQVLIRSSIDGYRRLVVSYPMKRTGSKSLASSHLSLAERISSFSILPSHLRATDPLPLFLILNLV